MRYKINETAGTVLDTQTGLEWQREVPPGRYTWAEAQQYAANLDLDGGGWRLPTVRELFGIVDRAGCAPAIDVVAFPGTPSEWFWTATPRGGKDFAWAVDFYVGSSFDCHTSLPYRVRCVRTPTARADRTGGQDGR